MCVWTDQHLARCHYTRMWDPFFHVRFRGACMVPKSAYYLLHVRPSVGTSPAGRISVEFDIGNSIRICRENPNLV